MNLHAMAADYACAFPKRPPLAASNEWLTGTWAIGACYKNPNPLYGAYPRGYLERVHSMFPNAERILHVFSGGLTLEHAFQVAQDAAAAHYMPDGPQNEFSFLVAPEVVELVDLKGPEDGRYPTWQGDILDMPVEWTGYFDLVLADPPYSPADAKKYGTPMPNRGKILQALRRVTRRGGSCVWLDTQWPMHRKTQWKTYGQIGLVRSTNHRVRLVTFFEAV